ncbi:hypothetical protein L1987_33907 [Smallanthus sonchifolius]|uniref:Uncharacterized protein n=1 Tax=Smallanthus sonchifolius TaxID=185202 RepID=A0ACB9HS58_9ASTR|nr:hypothetical protein L1987_33907 [Smallanthus sonchifolius]
MDLGPFTSVPIRHSAFGTSFGSTTHCACATNNFESPTTVGSSSGATNGFSPSHFAHWAATQSSPHYGLSFDLSGLLVD